MTTQKWKLVPVEPDANQIYAMRSAFSKVRRGGIGGQTMDACYQRENAPELSAYSAMLEAAPQPPAQSVPDGWRELCRRLYVELFHCDKQMTNTRDDDGESVWRTGATVRAVLDDAKAALDAAPTPAEPPADLVRDAERYRWLRLCRATGERWGGRWSLVIEGPCPDGDESSGAIDKAIDAARKRQGG